MIVTASPPPRRSSVSVHGRSPAAAASDARHTSPPTMHTPVRTTRATCDGTPASPAAGAATANAVATSASSPAYSSEPWPAAGWGGGGGTHPVAAPSENSPPRFACRLERGAWVVRAPSAAPASCVQLGPHVG